MRGNNRDRSGINGEFLCVKGRYGFDFNAHEERLTSPMIRINWKLEPVSWSKALGFVAEKFKSVKTKYVTARNEEGKDVADFEITSTIERKGSVAA